MRLEQWGSVAIAVGGLACGPTVVLPGASGGATDGSSGTTAGGGQDAATSSPTPTSVGPDPDDTGPVATTGSVPPPLDCVEGVVDDPWLHVDGTELDERATLEGVTVVNGDLVIHQTPDRDLSFLQCIREITGDLHIYDNDNLVDVSGLTWVERVGGDIIITDNDALVNFDALTLVSELGATENDSPEPGTPPQTLHSLLIVGNDSLERIDGLSSLQLVFGNLMIRDNPALVGIDGLIGIAGIGQTLGITHNPALCDSEVVALGNGIQEPTEPPSSWATVANRGGC